MMREEIVQANIQVHTIMADSYHQEPHFRPENRQKVRAILEQLGGKNKKLLDLGCGTGFIIDLAKDLFHEIHGVDVTQAMLNKVDTSGGNITLHNTTAENVPFADHTFDVVSAYSFIHHLYDYKPVLQEAYRVLKPGGICYIDLEPNKLFWDAIRQIVDEGHDQPLSSHITREVNSVLHTDSKVQDQFGIDTDLFNKAEYQKNLLGGIDPHELKQFAKHTGFQSIEVTYHWFLSQGAVMHGQSFEIAQQIENYLNEIKPLSDRLFKYIRFVLVK